MAAEKSIKRKPKPKSPERTEAAAEGAPSGNLLTRKDARYERRYEPKTSPMAIVSVLAMSIGAVAVGAGTFGQWLRAEELGPHKYAPYLLVAGAILLLGVALFGQSTAKPVRVGDAGVGLENEPSEIERIEWRDVRQLLLSATALIVKSEAASIEVPVAIHGQAVARILAEAEKRIPKRTEELNPGTQEALDDGQGEVLPLEAPQVAGEHCAKSNKLIAFEKDARFCKPCGEVYFKDDVPKRCVTCDARLL